MEFSNTNKIVYLFQRIVLFPVMVLQLNFIAITWLMTGKELHVKLSDEKETESHE